jgi:hypothetical protein
LGEIITHNTSDQEESDEQEEKEKKKSITFKAKSSRSRRRLRSDDDESTMFFFFDVIVFSLSSSPLSCLVIVATARANPLLQGVGERRCGPSYEPHMSVQVNIKVNKSHWHISKGIAQDPFGLECHLNTSLRI